MRIVKADATSVFTGYSRARQVVPAVTSCALALIGGCGGRIERAHIDHNPLNNVRQNITTLCKSHHNLYDFGRITLTNPVMPPFYVDARGKRRYPQKTLHVHPCQFCGVVDGGVMNKPTTTKDYRLATVEERAMARGFVALWDDMQPQDADEWLYVLLNRARLLVSLDEEDSREAQDNMPSKGPFDV